eukprot:TRINITY_DN3415_c0_g1_i1.p1 TRINITY_DN3415_c0_g1~~TRINITY_DN3415_c0_g1_i1.p1  ORF type:complete len:316 (+),score=110.57 TRINITY_DN3415_c0_g1_i1:155-1102(+)
MSTPSGAEDASDETSTSPELELPAIPVADGFANKAPISLAAYVQATQKLEGRDKLTKIVQYGSRFLFWYFKNVAPNGELADKAYSLYRFTQLSRKAFRMAKVADEVVRITALVESKQYPNFKSTVAILKCASMGAFWTYDNLNYLTQAKVIGYGTDRAMRGFSRSWAIANVAMIYLGVQTLTETSKRRQALAQEYKKAAAVEQGGDADREVQRIRGEVKAANVAHFSSCLTLCKAVLDLTVAVNMPGMDLPLKVFGKKLNDGVMGASGVLSALIVIFNCWPDKPKVAALPQVAATAPAAVAGSAASTTPHSTRTT